MKRTLRSRIALCLLAGSLVAATATAPQADAINPPQTSAQGLVNLLGFNVTTGYTSWGSIDAFWAQAFKAWGYTYYRPHSIHFYGASYGQYYVNSCGWTTSYGPGNGFYCRTTQRIYLDVAQPAGWPYGDYGGGGFLAHEWAHRIQHLLGYQNRPPRSEYHADCLAGMYTRWGYSVGRLTGNDYWEFYNWLYYQPSSTSHGTGANRAAWYQYGYNQYSLAACNRAYTSLPERDAPPVSSAKPGVLPPNTDAVNHDAQPIGLPSGDPMLRPSATDATDPA